MLNFNQAVKNLISEKKLKKPLVIAVGFTNDDLSNLIVSPIEEKLDYIDIDMTSKYLIQELIKNYNINLEYYSIRPEEFSLISDALPLFYNGDIVVVRNNVYDKTFPYSGTLSDVSKAYDLLYLSDDVELNDVDKQMLEKINKFYGKIDFSKNSNNYFISYKEELFRNFDHYNLYHIIDTDVLQTSNKQMDLSITLDDDEISFLDFQVQSDFSYKVSFIINNTQQIPHHFKERITILKNNHPQWNFVYSLNSIKVNSIENQVDYTNILNKFWGYNEFRDLNMYSNIEKRDKKIIKISQAQIIDDIVNQTQNARNGDNFRDIYITSSTGSGKSLMFQIPMLYLTEKYKKDKPLILVISPLIGLMNDQVDSMREKGITNVSTINGNTPLYEKQEILRSVNDSEIDMLYLSPETLQARGDIKRLIGNRKIGIVIVDEAHIVTTWGKSFRADYWYLGIYLQKLRKEYKFPIVTFTATAIYGGREDMYLDIRNSLNMIRPISYFGVVKRNDILMNIRYHDDNGLADHDYNKAKHVLAYRHLKNSKKLNQKSLLYFATVRSLKEFYRYLSMNDKSIANITGKYYGKLSKEEKDTVLEQFKAGNIKFVLATKAFGMGIDIPDINSVYHFNPTGNVVDYVQEIGRAARDNNKVIYGMGSMDYLPHDFSSVNRLHGMSSIMTSQIQGVMNKVIEIYRSKHNNRNLVVSADDFKYIFLNSSNFNEDDSNIDNKVKTVLLMIEKDFASSNKLGYSPFVARPRSVFGKELILANDYEKNILMNSRFKNYISSLVTLNGNHYKYVLTVDLSNIWERMYKNISFPSFKYKINTPSERDKLKNANLFKLFNFSNGVQYDYDLENANRISNYSKILESYQDFLDEKQRNATQFVTKDLGAFIKYKLKINNLFKATSLAQALINATFEFQKLKNVNLLRKREFNNKCSFTVLQSSDIFLKFVKNTIIRMYNPKYNYVLSDGTLSSFNSRNSIYLEEELIVLGIGEAFGIINFMTLGGYNPQIYIRINSIYPIEQSLKMGPKYHNLILEDVLMKHRISVAMQKFLFTKKPQGNSAKEKVKNYTNWFWNQIENYFMGELPEEVENKIYSEHKK